MSVNDFSPEMRAAVVDAADSVIRIAEGCTCLDCQQQAVEIIGRVVSSEQERCAKIADAMPWHINTSPDHIRGLKGTDVGQAIRESRS